MRNMLRLEMLDFSAIGILVIDILLINDFVRKKIVLQTSKTLKVKAIQPAVYIFARL